MLDADPIFNDPSVVLRAPTLAIALPLAPKMRMEMCIRDRYLAFIYFIKILHAPNMQNEKSKKVFRVIEIPFKQTDTTVSMLEFYNLSE